MLTQSQTENVPPPTRPTTRLQSQTVGLLEPMFPDITFMMSGADDAISVLDLLGLELSRMVTGDGEQSKHNEDFFIYIFFILPTSEV